MEPRFLDQFFQENAPPPEVNLDAIRQEWLALRPPYRLAERHLPLPVWARALQVPPGERPFTDDGPQAWQALCQDVPRLDPGRAFCIYVHIPFCAERCEFCDCYSFRLGAHRDRHVKGYLDLLAQEARLWSQLGNLAVRPVSTVHFGGGTPTFLSAGEFARLVGSLRECFADGPATEWALESSALELTPEMLAQLATLGFTRLHVGVQSLQDPVRQAVGRRASGTEVLRTLADAVELGWTVSVDLIYGLPGQTLDGLVADIRSLIAVGVDGFSLYELQVSGRNQRFAQWHGLNHRDRRVNYLLGQASARFLQAQGYKKTLFNHFAGEKDTNLYFTFPERGEDCLALGAVADGRFGDYHYRHPEYAAYCRSVDGHFPALEGGLRRNAIESRLEPLTVALMSARVPPALFEGPVMQRLLRRWCEAQLLQEDAQTGDLYLTGSGSWFVGNMISELLDHAEDAAGGDG